MKKILAIIDIPTLKKEGEKAAEWIERIEARGMKILLLSPWQKDAKTEAWLKKCGLDKHQSVFNHSAPTSILAKKKYAFEGTPTKWKLFMVNSLLERFKRGEAEPCDLIVVVDGDAGVCASMILLYDTRILPCESLEEANTIELVPRKGIQ